MEAIVIDTPQGIRVFHMLSQKYALHLELMGIKNSRGSVYAHIKRTYGLRGNKQSVYAQFCDLCEKEKLIR
jgi:hypothetical protein